jgi:hypothetical protein
MVLPERATNCDDARTTKELGVWQCANEIHSLHDAPCDWMFGPSTRNSHHPSHTPPAWNVGVAGRVCVALRILIKPKP